MSNLTIDKQKFLEYFTQFKDDIPYEIEMIDKIVTQLPVQVTESLMREYFYRYSCRGYFYTLTHCTYNSDINYFATLSEVIEFLKEHSLELSPELIDTFDEKFLNEYINSDNTLCGYYLRKEKCNR